MRFLKRFPGHSGDLLIARVNALKAQVIANLRTCESLLIL
jgi:hypothetical protein